MGEISNRLGDFGEVGLQDARGRDDDEHPREIGADVREGVRGTHRHEGELAGLTDAHLVTNEEFVATGEHEEGLILAMVDVGRL